MLASLGLQAAIYQTITADAELSALVRGVYDSLPQDTEFPYVVIGADTEKPWNSLTEIGRECTVTLHVFSQYPGMRECKQIAGRIIALLERQPASLGAVSSRLDMAQFVVDPDGVTRHGIVRFRLLVR